MQIAMVALLPALMALAGCTETIDGSSDAAFHRSLDTIHAGLDADKRIRFDQSLALIGMVNRDLSSPADAEPNMLAAVDGLTVDQVIAEATDLFGKTDRIGRERVSGRRG